MPTLVHQKVGFQILDVESRPGRTCAHHPLNPLDPAFLVQQKVTRCPEDVMGHPTTPRAGEQRIGGRPSVQVCEGKCVDVAEERIVHVPGGGDHLLTVIAEKAPVDEPRTLCDLKARARSFGSAVSELCACHLGELPRTSIVNGFLIVGDVVVAPLTMIPGEQNRDEACSRVKQILLDPNHTPVNYKEALEHQLRRSITSHLYDLLHKPRFVDNIPPPSRQQPTAKQFVTPAAFAAALKIATGGKPSAVTGLSQVSIANPQVEQPPAASASKAMSSAMPPSVSALGSEGEPKNQLDHDDGSDSSPGTCKPSSRRRRTQKRSLLKNRHRR